MPSQFDPASLDPVAAEAFRRLIQNLPSGDDLALVVLKGHLLIEERLYDLLALALNKRRASPKDAQLRFYQLIQLVKAMAYKADSDWLWTALEKLNSLRNDLAHHLEPQKVEQLATDFIAALRQKADIAPFSAQDNPAGRLRAAIGLLYGTILGVERAYREGTAA